MLARRWPSAVTDDGYEDAPVFVLAAGWRSGSTLLQRTLMPECFVWGEPYGHAGWLDGLAAPLRAMTSRWPEPAFVHEGTPAGSLADRFVANLYPHPAALREAGRAYLRTLCAAPAAAAGSDRWGVKEVRWSADHGAFLRWLFPRAKLLLLTRDPYACWRSYAAWRESGYRWFLRWPDQPLTPRLFGRHWADLATGFHANHAALGALPVRYESFAAGRREGVEDYLGFPLSAAAAAVRPPDGGPRPLAEIPAADLTELRSGLTGAAEALGYRLN